MKKELEDIAKKFFRVTTLETRNSDSLDFHDVAVWNMRDALEAAFEAGKQAEWVEATDRYFPNFKFDNE